MSYEHKQLYKRLGPETLMEDNPEALRNLIEFGRRHNKNTEMAKQVAAESKTLADAKYKLLRMKKGKKK